MNEIARVRQTFFQTALALGRAAGQIRSLGWTRLSGVVGVNRWEIAAGVGVTVIALVLHFYRLEREGYGNLYYAAAVKSMLSSWHNFFFASFDPGGFVSVDKPPLGLWVQAGSAWLFGFSGFSLLLPQALAGVLSVLLLYYLVRRAFGAPAGIIAAAVLAFSPISVAADRNNTMDSQLVLTSLLAAWAVTLAVESGRLRWLLLSALIVGLGFNIKMLQAMMVLPGIYLVYIVAAPIPVRRRAGHLILATLVLGVVSLAWAVAVDLTPADERPFVGSSRDNSVMELILGHNGIDRLGPLANLIGIGPHRGRPGAPPQPAGTGGPPGPQVPRPQPYPPPQDAAGQRPAPQPQPVPYAPAPGPVSPPNGPGGPASETGEPGLFRLFNKQLAGQATWLLPMAGLGLALALPYTRLRRAPPAQFRAVLLWGGWLLPQVVFFSFAGLFHRYYLEMLSPAIAAGVAVSIVLGWQEYRRGGRGAFLLPAALLGSAAVEVFILSDFYDWARRLGPLVLGLVITSALFLVALRTRDGRSSWARVAAGGGVLGLLVAPATWAGITVWRGGDIGLPFAGPELRGSPGPRRPPDVNRLVDYLSSNRRGERFLVATLNTNTAAPIILATGEPVMALGGFSGGDPILSSDELSRRVTSQEVRFFLLPQPNGPGGPAPPAPNQQTDLARWVERNCRMVNAPFLQPPPGPGGPQNPGPGGSNRLFDCSS